MRQKDKLNIGKEKLILQEKIIAKNQKEVIDKDIMSDLFTGNLYTIVLDYRKKTYVYQVFAKNSVEANLKWIKEVDLNEIGIFNTKGIKEELISEAMDETFFPVSMNNLQCVWSSSVTSFSEVDIHTKEYPVAYIITTSTTN
jgi:hypothetical protein